MVEISGAITTSNEAFLDAMIRHQIGLMRVNSGIEKKVIKLLNFTEADIAEKTRSKLRTVSGKGPTPRALQRSRELSKLIASIRGAAWDQIDEVWLEDLVNIAKSEPKFVSAAMQTTAPVQLQTVLPAPETLASIVRQRPFEGKTLRQWSKNIRQADITRLTDEIRIGVVQGETNHQIARRLVGTARLKGTDGATQITRRAAMGLTRTATIAFSNEAKRELFLANEDIIRNEQYVATLDSRTTLTCSGLDGEIFPVGQGPYPPVHFNCRSTRVAVFNGDQFGKRPFKTSTERQLTREFTEKKGLRRVSTRERLPRGTKGEFDEFARGRVRELTGRTPQSVSYSEFLKRQSVEFQNEVLGPTRARLFRKGGLTLDRFTSRPGDDIPLSVLAVKEKAAFIKAGLNPEGF